MFVVAAHGIIRKENKILVTRRSLNNEYKPGLWDVPGGKIEAGETVEEGLRREIREESNLEVHIRKIEYAYTNLDGLPKSQYVILVYVCDYKSGEVSLSPEEHDAYRWVVPHHIRTINAIHFLKEWCDHVSIPKG